MAVLLQVVYSIESQIGADGAVTATGVWAHGGLSVLPTPGGVDFPS